MEIAAMSVVGVVSTVAPEMTGGDGYVVGVGGGRTAMKDESCTCRRCHNFAVVLFLLNQHDHPLVLPVVSSVTVNEVQIRRSVRAFRQTRQNTLVMRVCVLINMLASRCRARQCVRRGRPVLR
jgi:hypothetical protein